jgi:hypothetical protein
MRRADPRFEVDTSTTPSSTKSIDTVSKRSAPSEDPRSGVSTEQDPRTASTALLSPGGTTSMSQLTVVTTLKTAFRFLE